MHRALVVRLGLIAVLGLAAGDVLAAPLERVASLSLPSFAHPTVLAGTPMDGRLFLGTRRSSGPELFAIDVSVAAEPRVLWSVEIGAHVRDIAVDGDQLIVATSGNRAEIVVVDAGSGVRVGGADLAGSADAGSVAIVGPGLARVFRRRSPQPEGFLLDVSSPAQIVVLETTEDPIGFRPGPAPTLPGYEDPSRLVGRVDEATGASVRHYLAVDRRDAQLQILEHPSPVAFEDVNRDGRFRLACLGDSNSAETPFVQSWCRILAQLVDDEVFEVLVIAEGNATAAPQTLPGLEGRDAYHHLPAAIAADADAVIMAYGTNDRFQGYDALDFLDALAEHTAVAEAAGLHVFLATVPPVVDALAPTLAWLATANDGTRALVAPSRVVEFHDGFTSEHFAADRIHVNDLGKQLRAERAFAVLTAG